MLGVPAPTTTRIVGVDLSLTATGICYGDWPAVVRTTLRGCERLIRIRDEILKVVDHYRSPLILLEGYSYASANQAHQLGELGGVIRTALFEHAVSYTEIPPAVLKKFATGKGNAGKPDMLAAAIRTGYDGPNDDNAVDAWWLHQMGQYVYGHGTQSIVPANQYRDDAIAKTDWPNLEVVA